MKKKLLAATIGLIVSGVASNALAANGDIATTAVTVAPAEKVPTTATALGFVSYTLGASYVNNDTITSAIQSHRQTSITT
ncbi:hypothetical protein D5085_11005 [Ectothiorhodospiraceae bacterium BW-2]|nr:hypothetical protein D5085_11005 [Ectothiorhodospiraceae bacterium BW-2]